MKRANKNNLKKVNSNMRVTSNTRKNRVNNEMKTKISQIAAVVLFALFIFAGNAKADGLKKDASSHENIEATLNIENWMINENIWDTKEVIICESENEEALPLENWMTNENLWDLETEVGTETEQNLAIEPWMINENVW